MQTIFTAVLLFCGAFLSVISAPVISGQQGGSWCTIEEAPENTTGTMVCSFKEQVNHAQLDFYLKTGSSAPEIAVTCFTNCDVAQTFMAMLSVNSTQDKALTLSVLSVPARGVGRYRCQATSVSSGSTIEGNCLLHLTNASLTGTDLGDKPTAPPPSQDYESGHIPPSGEEAGPTYLLFLLLIIPVVAVIVVSLIICKKKSCGFWKKPEDIATNADDPESPALPPCNEGKTSFENEKQEGCADAVYSEDKDDVSSTVSDREITEPFIGDNDNDSDSGMGSGAPYSKQEHPMMDKIRSEFAKTHSPATCKKRTMMRQELKYMFDEEARRSQKK